jgi:hypothetical protein
MLNEGHESDFSKSVSTRLVSQMGDVEIEDRCLCFVAASVRKSRFFELSLVLTRNFLDSRNPPAGFGQGKAPHLEEIGAAAMSTHTIIHLVQALSSSGWYGEHATPSSHASSVYHGLIGTVWTIRYTSEL